MHHLSGKTIAIVVDALITAVMSTALKSTRIFPDMILDMSNRSLLVEPAIARSDL